MLETPARIEPCLFEEHIPVKLADLAINIQKEAIRLEQGVHPELAADLADMVRIMNCSYSNMIEGHAPSPDDIERAIAGSEKETAPLALEARAHIMVQRKIDILHQKGNLPRPTSVEFLTWIHKEFHDKMPDEFRVMKYSDGTQVPIIPGRMRQSGDPDVAVGRHIPPSSSCVETFMRYFEKRFQISTRSLSQQIIAIPSAHHRLNYIHPFPDGNGRVSRLMSHAMALKAGIGSQGLWSISRGLARGLADRSQYMRMMDYADNPRFGSRDGRGNLSQTALKEFSEWFLKVILDQITFSTMMFDLNDLEKRYRQLVANTINDKRAPDLITIVLRSGTLNRGDASIMLKTSERTARNTLGKLINRGYLTSCSPKTPVRVVFPIHYREHLFPNLFSTAEPPTARQEPEETQDFNGGK